MCHLDIPTCSAVSTNAGYVNLCIVFQCFQNFLIENILDVSKGGSIKIMARIHDQIRLFGCQIAQFENRSNIQNLIDIKYHTACANANTPHMIPSHCLINTIFLIYDHIFVWEKISARGLEKTIISSKIRAIFQKSGYSSGFINIATDNNDR